MASTSSTSEEAATQAVRAFLSDAPTADLPAPLRAQLESGQLSLLGLIRILGPHLTDEDEAQRGRAIRLLAIVVIDLAPASTAQATAVQTKLFERQATLTLAAFFASKLEDAAIIADNVARAGNAAAPIVPGSVAHRLKGIPDGAEALAAVTEALTKLAALDVFGSEAAKQVSESLFEHIRPSHYPQALRYLLFRLLDVLVARHRTSLKASMGQDFLKGYLKMVEGEKDPRNLLYCFATDWVLLREWDIGRELAEQFFDTTYCYFPITFRPPPDDPYGITTLDLTLALRRCLIATPALAPFAMPLLLEKLQAAGGNAKIETLRVLEEGLPVFGKEACMANEKQLWESFRIEIMHATDEPTSLAAQRALVSFLRVLYIDVDPPAGLAPRIVADALEALEEPSKSLAKPAASILACMVRAAPSTAYLAVYGLLGQMLAYWKNADDVSVRGPILEHIGVVLKALRDSYEGREDWSKDKDEKTIVAAAIAASAAVPKFGVDTAVTPTPSSAEGAGKVAETAKITSARSYEGDNKPLDSFRDDLVAALANGLRSTSYRLPALHAFLAVARIPGFLETQEIDYLTEGVNELLLSAYGDDVRGAALDGLRELSARSNRVMEGTTLPLLFAALPDRIAAGEGEEQEAQKARLRRALSALARLCAQPDLFEALVVRLATKLDLACAPTYATPQEREANVGYVRGLLVTLQTLLEDKAALKHTDLPMYAVSLPPKLLSLVYGASLRAETDAAVQPVACDARVVEDIGLTLSTLVRYLGVEKQRELVAWLYPAMESGTQGPLKLAPGVVASTTFRPLAPDAPTAHRTALAAFLAATLALSKAVPTPRNGDGTAWAADLLSWTSRSTSKAEELAGCSALASLFNKSIAEPLPEAAAALLESFWTQNVAKRDGNSKQQRRLAVRIWCWITKGLCVRTSKNAEGMLGRLLELFADADVGKDAARGMGVIAIGTEDGVLSKENGAVVRLLHRQRFFSFVLPKIITGYRTSQPEATSEPSTTLTLQGTYLIALAALLPSMPRQTTRERLADLFPLLIRALDLPDALARASAAQTIALAAAVGKKERTEELLEAKGADGAPKREGAPLDLVESHTSTLIERLIFVATKSEFSPPETRTAALRCLATLARTVTYSVLHPHRVRIQRALSAKGVGIDDPRRSVRVDAVEARDAWLTLKGTPEDE